MRVRTRGSWKRRSVIAAALALASAALTLGASVPLRTPVTDAPDGSRISGFAAGGISGFASPITSQVPLPTLHSSPQAMAPVASKHEDIQTYKGKRFRYVTTLNLRITAYAPDPRCTYPYDGTTTASGLPVTTNGGRLVAADTRLIPMHSLVVVPGYAAGKPVPVLDRGGAIKGHRLDVLLPTFDKAKIWGVKNLPVKIYHPIPNPK